MTIYNHDIFEEHASIVCATIGQDNGGLWCGVKINSTFEIVLQLAIPSN